MNAHGGIWKYMCVYEVHGRWLGIWRYTPVVPPPLPLALSPSPAFRPIASPLSLPPLSLPFHAFPLVLSLFWGCYCSCCFEQLTKHMEQHNNNSDISVDGIVQATPATCEHTQYKTFAFPKWVKFAKLSSKISQLRQWYVHNESTSTMMSPKWANFDKHKSKMIQLRQW